MRAVHLKEYPDFYELGLRNKITACILRNDKEIVIEYLDDGNERLIKAQSNNGYYFEGKHYDVKPRESILGDVVLRLYKSPISDKEYLLFGRVIPYGGSGKPDLVAAELVVDQVIEG